MVIQLDAPIVSIAFVRAVSDALRREQKLHVDILAREIMSRWEVSF